MTSVSAAIARQPVSERPAAEVALRRERRFFTGIAIVMALVVFAGFAPSYYLKSQFSTGTLKPLLHFHGLVFTLWMLLLVVQTSLVAAKRVRLHRRLGIASIGLVVLMVISGAAVAYVRGKEGAPGMPQEMLLGFLALAFVALIIFPSLIGAALYLRRNTAAHKRLMIAATTVFAAAAVHRLFMWAYDPAVSPPVFFGATDLFIVALAVYDFRSLGRLHPATIWGGLVVILGQVGALMLAGSQTWITFARWITGT